MPAKPNVVIIMTDQQRADLSKREGFALDTTPFLDSLAEEGVWFNKSYTVAPLCAPARISMLTGRYPSATHSRTNHNIEDAFFTKDLFTLFREQGYKTCLCGKNHSHITPEHTDAFFEAGHNNMGGEERTEQEKEFDRHLGTEGHFHMLREPNPFPAECQIPYRIVSRAEKWISSVNRNPFFMWLSFPEPHNPYQVPEPYYSMFEDNPAPITDSSALQTKGFPFQFCRDSFKKAFPDFDETLPRARSNYLGMLRLLDDRVKRFVEFLEEKNLKDDTIIIFVSDHGDFAGEYGLMRKGPELCDSLTRIPFQITGPGIQGYEGPHPAHVSIADLMPTLCEAIGADLPEGVQGRSLWPLLTGQDYPEEEFRSAYAEQGFGGLHYTENEPFDPTEDGLGLPKDGKTWGGYDCLNSWTQSGTMRMVRKDDWKLVYDMQGNGQLYNLKDDPSEMENFFESPEHGDKKAELLEELLTWMLRIQDPLPLPRRRYRMKTDPRNYYTPYKNSVTSE